LVLRDLKAPSAEDSVPFRAGRDGRRLLGDSDAAPFFLSFFEALSTRLFLLRSLKPAPAALASKRVLAL